MKIFSCIRERYAVVMTFPIKKRIITELFIHQQSERSGELEISLG